MLRRRMPGIYKSHGPSGQNRVIDLRNRIVADEYGIQLHNNPEYTARKLEEINASTLNERGLRGRFWETYLRPPIDRFQEKLQRLSAIEKSYFYAHF